VIYDVERLMSIPPIQEPDPALNGKTQGWVLMFDDVEAGDDPDAAFQAWASSANPPAGRYRLIWPGSGSGAGAEVDRTVAEYDVRLTPTAERSR
jgi:hypothetical protein